MHAPRLAWSLNLSAELSALYDRPGASTFPRTHHREHDPHLRWDHMRFDMLGPVGPLCPTPLERYGKGDDEKRACGLSSQNPCEVLSIGSNGRWDFEEALFALTQCRVHTFDCTTPNTTQPPPAIASRVFFHPVCIGASDKQVPYVGEFLSWPSLLARAGLLGQHVSFVKMDVEGFEYDILPAMLAAGRELLPEQLAIELHFKTRFRELPWFGRYKSAGEIGTFMDLLYRRGDYHITDRHDNRFCQHCTELLLSRHPQQVRGRLNRTSRPADRMSVLGAGKQTPVLPHPLRSWLVEVAGLRHVKLLHKTEARLDSLDVFEVSDLELLARRGGLESSFAAVTAEKLKRALGRPRSPSARSPFATSVEPQLYQPSTLVDQWLENGADGYCGETTAGGDCGRDAQGSMPLQEWETMTWWHAAARCMTFCGRCAGCKFMTVSLRHADCSWYRACDLSRLKTGLAGFRSGAVDAVHARAAPPLRAYRPRNAWRSYAIPPTDASGPPWWGPALLHNCWVAGRLGDIERLPRLAIDNMRGSAPGFTHRLHSDDECSRLLRSYGQRFARTYNLLRRGAHRADLCKYAVLHAEGGVYLDIDAKPLAPLPTVFGRPGVLTTVLSYYNGSINQGIIAAPPRHPIFLAAMQSLARSRRRSEISNEDYLNFTFVDFHRLVAEDLGGKVPTDGLNVNVRRQGLDYYLLRERCSRDAALCRGKLDQKLRLCCVIYDGSKPVFLQREAGFPFQYPW